MAKKKKKSKQSIETDITFVLKLILYVIVGSQWLFLVNTEVTKQIPIPLGFGFGLLFASHEHFQIDRKIEYVALIMAMLIGFFAQSGISLVVLK